MRQLGGIDAAFLYCETPTMTMEVCGLVVVDPSACPAPFSGDLVVEMFRERLPKISLLRHKLVSSPLHIGRPVWREDMDFDVGRHLSRIECSGGDESELAVVVGDAISRPLRRDRPLWEVVIIDGLANGAVAVLVKLHHSMIDGVSSTEVMGPMFDLEPVVEFEAVEVVRRKPEPSWLQMLGAGLRERLLEPFEVARLVPSTVAGLTAALKARPNDGSGEEGAAAPFRAPRTAFNGTISARRSVSFAEIDLDQIRGAKDRLGVKVNDVLTAIVGGALREYLLSNGHLPDRTLIAAEPVSIHDTTRELAGNTKLSVMFSKLRTDISDPVERVRSIAAGNKRAKDLQNQVGADKLLAWSEHFFLNGLAAGARAYSKLRLANLHPVVHNLIFSNVAGPPMPLYFAGARVKMICMFGPVLDGAALNITALSHEDHVVFGLIACTDLVPDVSEIADALPRSAKELFDAAGGVA